MKHAFNAQLQVQFLKQGKYTVAYSPALDISTSGKNQTQARKRFAELANIFIREIMERGTAHQILTELGWTHRAHAGWAPPKMTKSPVSVRIPVAA